MPTLHVALQEGFANDRVIVRINGAEVASRPSVTTRNQIGLAEAVEIDLVDGDAQVEVEVPTRGITSAVRVQVEGTTYVGASIEAGQVSLHQQREAFRYL
jgi:hypothetical protein